MSLARLRPGLGAGLIVLGLMASFFGQLLLVGDVAAVCTSSCGSGVGSPFYRPTPPSYTWLPANHRGTRSIKGSLMPDLTSDGSGALVGINSTDDLYNYLWNSYNSSDDWRKMGAATIVHMMRGVPWGGAGRTVSTSEWDDLRARLLNPKITIDTNGWFSEAINTGGVFNSAGEYDAMQARYTNPASVPSILLRYQATPTSYPSIVFALQIACANPLGGLSLPPGDTPEPPPPPDPPPPPSVGPDQWEAAHVNTWIVNNRTGAYLGSNYGFGRVGEKYNFNTNWINNGTISTGTDVNVTGVDASRGGSWGLGGGYDTGPGGTIYNGPLADYTPKASDGGQEYCYSSYAEPPSGYIETHWESEFVGYVPDPAYPPPGRPEYRNVPKDERHVNGGRADGAQACLFIPYQYRLTPSIETPSRIVVAEENIGQINGRIDNSGPTWSPPDMSWQLIKYIVSPTGGAGPWQVVDGNTQSAPIKGSLSVSADGGQVGELEVGSQICFLLRVNRYDQDNMGDLDFKQSSEVCFRVFKKPKVQIWGGDVRVRGKISTSTSVIGTQIYGSWVEYGALATDTIDGFASGSAYANTTGTSPNALTFANTPPPTLGAFQVGDSQAENLIAQFTKDPPQGQSNGWNLGNEGDLFSQLPSGLYRVDQPSVRITASNKIPPGRSIIILASENTTVEIISNITYEEGPYANITSLPQVVIIANKINIRGNVSNVDAWLIGRSSSSNRSSINTCSDEVNVEDPLSSQVCDVQLKVNGPIITNKLYLRRTAGSGVGADNRGIPAEILNLRADAYLWAASHTQGFGKVQTITTSELPPRF